MDQSNPQSVLNNAAAMVRGFWAVLVSGFGRAAAAVDLDAWIAAWVERIFCKLDDLLARYRAGELVLAGDAGSGSDEARAVCADLRARGCGRGMSERFVARGTPSAAVVAGACEADCAGHQAVARKWASAAVAGGISTGASERRAFVGAVRGWLKKRVVDEARNCAHIVPVFH